MEQENQTETKEQTFDAPTRDLLLKSPESSPLLLLGSGLAVVGLLIASALVSMAPERTEAPVAETQQEHPLDPAPFEALDLQAQAVYIYDAANDQALYVHNAQTQLPLASLTKVMTAIVATESLAYDSIVSIDADSLHLEGDSGLYVKERWRARDLLDFMLLASSNDSAHVLAQAAGAAVVTAQAPQTALDPYDAFINRMNQKAKDIGLSQTYFINETGLDASAVISGGYGSAKDMARLFTYALQNTPEALDATSYKDLEFTSLSNITHYAENTNEIVNKIPGLIASKTGYTTLAGGNLVVAFDAGINRPIIISVLGSTLTGRFEDMEKLVAATLSALQQQHP